MVCFTDFVMADTPLVVCVSQLGKFAGSVGFKRKDDNDREQTFHNRKRDLCDGKDAHKGGDGRCYAAFCAGMRKTKLHACNAVGEQISQSGCQENGNRFVDLVFPAKTVNAVAQKRTSNRHREGVRTQGGQTAVCEQQRLKQQNDDADDAHRSRTEQNRTQAGAGRMRAGAGDARQLQGGKHKGVRTCHCENQQGLAVLGNRLFDGDKSGSQKWQTQRAPRNRVSHRKIPFHDVHCAGAGWHRKEQCGGNAEGEQTFFTFFHG